MLRPYTKPACVAVLLLALCLLSLFSTALSAKDPSLSHEENVRKALKEWERAMSGKPINCRRFVDLFKDDGVWASPAGTNKTSLFRSPLKGQRKIYDYCESQRLFSGFDQVEAFISGPVYISGNTAAFHRTFLLVVKDVPCRMTWQGIATLDFNSDYLITKWRDYWEEAEFERQWKGCQFPPIEDEELADADLLAAAAEQEAAKVKAAEEEPTTTAKDEL